MRPPRRDILSLFILFLWCTPALVAQTQVSQLSDRWNSDVRDLAVKITAAAAPARSLTISVKNLSSLKSSDATAIGNQLQAELTRNAFYLGVADSADVAITLTLSEGSEGYVWVAELRTRTSSKVVMTTPKALPKSDTPARQSIFLSESALISSVEPVLDFSLASTSEGRSLLLLLRPERLELLERHADSWASLSSALIHHSGPWPRDLRGHIETSSQGQFKIFLPGVQCTGSVGPSLSMECHDIANATWLVAEPLKSISLTPDRNYFASLDVSVDHSTSDLSTFYSFAIDPTGGHTQAILTGVDGNVLLLSEKGASIILPLNWGDDVAPLSIPCAVGWYVLADATGDWSQTDRFQTFSISSSSAIPAGHPLDLSGPVLTLWPSNDGKAVRAVLRNLETGMYEASMVSASCDN